MKCILTMMFLVTLASTRLPDADSPVWYAGDKHCPPPKDDGTYSPPYNALDHPHEYPTFREADKHGWSCSYQREDGVIVQFGDSRTPQEQWLNIWGGNDSN